ncbi:hypothetical protein AOLI_G00169340 [Acnodon oligacanthus]
MLITHTAQPRAATSRRSASPQRQAAGRCESALYGPCALIAVRVLCARSLSHSHSHHTAEARTHLQEKSTENRQSQDRRQQKEEDVNDDDDDDDDDANKGNSKEEKMPSLSSAHGPERGLMPGEHAGQDQPAHPRSPQQHRSTAHRDALH